MRDIVSKLLHKSVLVTLGSTLVVAGAIAAGVITLAQPNQASAATSCTPKNAAPETNIIYCGLEQKPDGTALSTPSQMRDNLKAYFDGAQSDGHNSDIHTALVDGGLTSSMFSSGNWYLTTSYDKNSDSLSPGNSSIVLNGKVIATNLFITSRCPNIPVNCKEEPQGMYVKVEGNVYKRDANWFFDKDANNNLIHSNQVLVHINSNGVADFAIWTKCGNMIMVTPVVPKSLVCKQLDAVPGTTTDTSITYTFTVTATVQNTPNITYTINYGDGSKVDSKSVTNGQATATFTHAYTRLETDKTYTASAQVNGQPQVAACQKSFKIPAQKKLTFACKALTAHVDSSSNGSITYTFTGSTTGTDTAKDYQFFFGDNNQTDVQTSNTATHTYTFDTSSTHTFTAYFVSTSATGLKTDQSDKNCQYSFSTQLVETGPAGIAGLMAGTTVLGVGIHQFLLRRKLNA